MSDLYLYLAIYLVPIVASASALALAGCVVIVIFADLPRIVLGTARDDTGEECKSKEIPPCPRH